MDKNGIVHISDHVNKYVVYKYSDNVFLATVKTLSMLYQSTTVYAGFSI